MTQIDAILMGLSIGLGLLSIGLAIFAIWLSHRFSESSAAALDAVKELARETRTLVDASLAQQKDFSSKMLDSILEQNKYGRTDSSSDPNPSATINQVIKQTLDDFASKIVASVEIAVRKLAAPGLEGQEELQKVLASVRAEIGKLSEAAPLISSVVHLPPSLSSTLAEFRDHPAHYVLLAAILRSGATTDSDLEAVKEEYSLALGWEGGVERLLEKGVLKPTKSGFKVPESHQGALGAWVDRNWALIRSLIREHKRKPVEGVTDDERSLGYRFEH